MRVWTNRPWTSSRSSLKISCCAISPRSGTPTRCCPVRDITQGCAAERVDKAEEHEAWPHPGNEARVGHPRCERRKAKSEKRPYCAILLYCELVVVTLTFLDGALSTVCDT